MPKFDLHVYMYTTCIQYLWMPGENVRSLRTGVKDGYGPFCRAWEPNLIPLQEQPTLLTAMLSFKP